ncbi:MAG: hypothetical protein J0H68_02075 [Sphingobacteriia bacterium]|nr:hypothetical protein [Sphingobacteriia bacterium]
MSKATNKRYENLKGKSYGHNDINELIEDLINNENNVVALDNIIEPNEDSPFFFHKIGINNKLKKLIGHVGNDLSDRIILGQIDENFFVKNKILKTTDELKEQFDNIFNGIIKLNKGNKRFLPKKILLPFIVPSDDNKNHHFILIELERKNDNALNLDANNPLENYIITCHNFAPTLKTKDEKGKDMSILYNNAHKKLKEIFNNNISFPFVSNPGNTLLDRSKTKHIDCGPVLIQTKKERLGKNIGNITIEKARNDHANQLMRLENKKKELKLTNVKLYNAFKGTNKDNLHSDEENNIIINQAYEASYVKFTGNKVTPNFDIGKTNTNAASAKAALKWLDPAIALGISGGLWHIGLGISPLSVLGFYFITKYATDIAISKHYASTMGYKNKPENKGFERAKTVTLLIATFASIAANIALFMTGNPVTILTAIGVFIPLKVIPDIFLSYAYLRDKNANIPWYKKLFEPFKLYIESFAKYQRLFKGQTFFSYLFDNKVDRIVVTPSKEAVMVNNPQDVNELIANEAQRRQNIKAKIKAKRPKKTEEINKPQLALSYDPDPNNLTNSQDPYITTNMMKDFYSPSPYNSLTTKLTLKYQNEAYKASQENARSFLDSLKNHKQPLALTYDVEKTEPLLSREDFSSEEEWNEYYKSFTKNNKSFQDIETAKKNNTNEFKGPNK